MSKRFLAFAIVVVLAFVKGYKWHKKYENMSREEQLEVHPM